MDSIRQLHPTPRLDSINNGADDDGSGSMAVLEIAEAIMAMPVKPKRSHALRLAHRRGGGTHRLGVLHAQSRRCPIDSIVAQINVDMIGRGRAEDLPGGGDDYVGVVGLVLRLEGSGRDGAGGEHEAGEPAHASTTSSTTRSRGPATTTSTAAATTSTTRARACRSPSSSPGCTATTTSAATRRSSSTTRTTRRSRNYLKELTVEVGNGPRPRLNGTKPVKPKVIG